MNKILLSILLIFILLSCNTENNGNQEVIIKKADSTKSNISEIKINNEVSVNKNVEETTKIEGKELITADKLFDFFPKKYKNLDLIEESSGNSSSGLGRFTTSTGAFDKNNKYIKIRLSDYYGEEYFPDMKYLVNIPNSDETFLFQKAIINNDIIGYVQWHKVEDYGIINLFAYGRFNIYLEINGFPEIKQEYKSFIESFDIKKLKEISVSK